ncbi:MAG: UDP-N-acetylglucosamine 2-epimerase (non-hydrolyzing) [Limosilactobacillus sp.]|uniref:non-hydrolyzing UDP-N-acetylglucosamine 2-epimerase n=1 Tax=Limosilactobacillus sp. TaxID=2773925 RepID=UPI0027077D26|nr:UDP-N-acetylglucosamine 2-epimerase (non-hydrolyzing) [Limosilactobacillus sp.]
MQAPYCIMFLLGTRAEALKLAPVIKIMKANEMIWQPVVVTAPYLQQNDLLSQALDYLQIEPDFELATVDKNGQRVEELSQLLHNLDNVVNASQPDMLLVVGDASTSLAASLVGFYHQLPISHVEAGLRTYDKLSPFPDEMHRRLTDDLADLYFAPTAHARDNLLAEHHPAERIYVTGNTSIDMVNNTLDQPFDSELLDQIPEDHRMIILTMERPENIGEPMRAVFHTVKDIVETNEDVELIYPVFPNADVESMADEILGKHDRIHLIKPLDHGSFIHMAARSTLIITDSGSIQEEAPALHKPVLLLREKTERQEAVDCGAVKVVGTNPTSIQQTVFDLLNHHKAYKQMAEAENRFGDGHASEHICAIIEDYLQQH